MQQHKLQKYCLLVPTKKLWLDWIYHLVTITVPSLVSTFFECLPCLY